MALSSVPKVAALLAAAALLAVSCQKDREPIGPTTAADMAAPGAGALPLVAPAPADNPGSPAKTALGRALFWDPVLSGGQDVSCGCPLPRWRRRAARFSRPG